MEINILVVDDELLLRDVLYDFLIKKSYKVFLAPDGYKALGIIEKNNIDIAVVDIKMPGISGIELTEKILKFNDEIQVIIMTGYPSVSSATKALKLGAKEYLVKPFRLSELGNLINKLLVNKKGYEDIRKLEEEIAELKKKNKLSDDNHVEEIIKNEDIQLVDYPKIVSRNVDSKNDKPVTNKEFAKKSYSNFSNSEKKKKLEELLNRLEYLNSSGVISEKDYLKKKSEILKNNGQKT
jgi:DNA-binding response OmpR family regulator